MDDLILKQPVRTKAKITDAEMARRRKIGRQADAENRIEGIYRDPASDEVFQAFIRGDIEVTDIAARLEAQTGPR